MLYNVVLTFESVDEILKCDHSNESYWAVLSCGAVYYAVQGGSTVHVTFESVDEIQKCDHSNESYWAVLFFGTALLFKLRSYPELPNRYPNSPPVAAPKTKKKHSKQFLHVADTN